MNISDVQFPLTLPRSPVRRWLKTCIGAVLCQLMPSRVRDLYAGKVGTRLNTIDRVLIAALVSRHEREGTLDKLAGLQRWLWEGQQAVDFHAQAESRFQSWWLDGASRIVQPIQMQLQIQAGRIHTLCEIGCGSGLVLDDLRQKLPEISNFVGLDLSAAQTERNRVRFSAPSIRFEAGDASAWIPANAAAGWLYFTNAGVLEYFSESQLKALFSAIVNQKQPAMFALVEPIAHDYDLKAEHRSRPFSSERTFSHHYIHLLTLCGWTVQWNSELRVETSRHLMVVATAS